MPLASWMQANIYIHVNEPRIKIAQDLSQLLQAKTINFHTIEDREHRYDIAVKINKGGSKPEDPVPTSFHYFCYYLDYSPEDDLDEQISIEVLTKILDFFWQNNIPTVVDCGYSENLPVNDRY